MYFLQSDWNRFLGKVEFTDSCWIWTGAKSNSYGVFWFLGRNQYVHRVAYQVFVGEIPFLYEIDHVKELCSSKLCVNPDHLEAVTGQENMYRKNGSTKRFCKNGHSRSVHGTTNNRGTFVCRACDAKKARERRARGL